jgi:Na+/H+-dicarboxylate symporter
VVLPQLIENVKELFRRSEIEGEEVESTTELLMPLAYPFPNVGTLAILMFVPFAAWYLGRVLSFGDWLVFLGAGTLSSFAVVIPKPDVTLGSSGSGAVNPQALSSSMPPRQV